MNKIISFFSICLLAVSCTKRDEIGTPVFDVTTTATTYKVGDTITFNITGDPQNIVFGRVCRAACMNTGTGYSQPVINYW
nr:DUF5017 domain-containing protein [Paraflavitalea speifideiaquila]